MVRMLVLASLVAGTVGCTAGWMQNLENEPGIESAFVGGRGLVTSEGPAGMWINPTSGTLPKGTLAAESCVAIFNKGTPTNAGPDTEGTFVGNKILVTYALTDWFELGATSLDIQNDSRDPAIGPHFRARVLKDKEGSALPEVAAGYYANEGRSVQRKRAVFVAASKEIPLPGRDGERRVFRSARVHAGVRNAWRDLPGTDESDFVGYFGAEIELPYHVWLVGEVQTEELNYPHLPFGFGVQVRHPDGIGLSFGGMQPGFSSDIGLYVGIGIGFSW